LPNGNNLENGLHGALAAEPLHPVSRVADMPLRIENRVKKVVVENDTVVERPVKFPIWFDPTSRGKTAMCAGLNRAVDILKEWCERHPTGFPPTLLHVTDGHPTDGNPEPIASTIKSLTTTDGASLFFNLHVDVGEGSPLIFPNDERLLRDRFGKTLFRMSSALPPHAVAAAKGKGYDVRPGAQAFVFNAGIEAIVDFFDIGTRPAVSADR
jgi:hypothetical protein